MVVTLKYNIDVQLVKNGDQCFAAVGTVIIVMAGYCVDGMVEGNDLPIHIGVGCDGSLHKCLVLSRRQVIGVEYHKQRIVVNEPVVTAGRGGAVLRRFIGNVEVLAVGIRTGVVVSDDSGHGQVLQSVMIQIAVILALATGSVDLVTGGKQEGDVRENVVLSNDVQGVVPAGSIAGHIAAGADLGVSHVGEGESRVTAIGGNGINVRLSIPIHNLIGVGSACLQTGSNGLVGVLAVVIDNGSGGKSNGTLRHHTIHQITVLCDQQGAGIFGGAVPGEVALAPIRTHGKADVGYLGHGLGQTQLAHIEPNIRAGFAALVQLHGDGVGTHVQQLQVIHSKCTGARIAAIGTAELEILGDNHIQAITALIAGLILVSGHTLAVDIDHQSIVIRNGTGKLVHIGKILGGHLKGGAEEVSGGVVLAVSTVQDRVGNAAARNLVAALLGSKGTATSLPCIGVKVFVHGLIVFGCPAGALILTGRVATVIQIAPNGVGIDQSLLLPVHGGDQFRQSEEDIGAGGAVLMDLYGDDILAIHQYADIVQENLTGAGSILVGITVVHLVLPLEDASFVAMAEHAGAVDIHGNAVVVNQAAAEGGDFASNFHRGAEEISGSVVGLVAALQHGLGFIAADCGSADTAGILGAERTDAGLPVFFRHIVCGGPAGTLVGTGGVRVVVQIGPLGGGINQRFFQDRIIV